MRQARAVVGVLIIYADSPVVSKRYDFVGEPSCSPNKVGRGTGTLKQYPLSFRLTHFIIKRLIKSRRILNSYGAPSRP